MFCSQISEICVALVCVSVRFVRKRTNYNERNIVVDAYDSGCSAFHLTCESIIIIMQSLHVFTVCNKLVAGGNRSLEYVIIAYNFDCRIISELYKLRIAIVVNARFASESGIARTPFKSVV